MSDEKLIEIEHTLEKADDDLTQLTKDVKALREAHGKELDALKAENKELRGAISEIVKAFAVVERLTYDRDKQRILPEFRDNNTKLIIFIEKLSKQFPA